jgi:hypothetical protein
MKTRILLIFAVLLITACSKKDDLNQGDGFWMEITAKDIHGVEYNEIISTSDIEAYDVSAHMIYLKNSKPYISDLQSGVFHVYVKDTKIYTGSFISAYSSSLPEGVLIATGSPLSLDYVLELKWLVFLQNVNDPIPDDPRTDSRIINALKAHNQYREGLSCNILSIQFQDNNKVEFSFELKNNDAVNYYYLDPDKMEIGLFHYYNNGLTFRSEQSSYTHKMTIIHPDSWDSWDISWLSIIKPGETKTYTVNYDDYDVMPPGKYRAYFTFFGLFPVEQKDWEQSDGKIWLGGVSVSKDIVK